MMQGMMFWFWSAWERWTLGRAPQIAAHRGTPSAKSLDCVTKMLYSPARQSHPECTVSCSALSAARDLALTTEAAKHKPAVPAKTSALAAHTAATRRHSVSWTSSSAIAMKSRAGMDSRPTKAERPAASDDDRMASRRHRRPSRIMLTHWHSAVASGSSICPTPMRLVS